jgi:hypothetical protein
MGRLLALLSPEADVFLVASTGMADHYPTTGLIEAFCRRLGYQASPRSAQPSLRGPASNPLAAIRRTVPEPWRLALSQHLPRAIRERLLGEPLPPDLAGRPIEGLVGSAASLADDPTPGGKGGIPGLSGGRP